MPDLVVHNAMGDRVLARLPEEIRDEIDSNAFHVGVLGPDPFFFYRFFALPFTHGVDKRGKTMHHKRCGAFLMQLAVCEGKHRRQSASGKPVRTVRVRRRGEPGGAGRRTVFHRSSGRVCREQSDRLLQYSGGVQTLARGASGICVEFERIWRQ